MPEKLPPKAREMLRKLKRYQQQLQTITTQKRAFKNQKQRIQKALDELEGLEEEKEVYKSVGPIMIKSKKPDVEKDLKEKKGLSETRVSSFEKQEKKIRDTIEGLQEKLQSYIK